MTIDSGLSLVRFGAAIVASPSVDLDDRLLDDLRDDVLAEIDTTDTTDVVLDLAGLTVIDDHQAAVLDELARTVAVLGATLHLTGIRPGVAISLMHLRVRFDHARTARTAEDVLMSLGILNHGISR